MDLRWAAGRQLPWCCQHLLCLRARHDGQRRAVTGCQHGLKARDHEAARQRGVQLRKAALNTFTEGLAHESRSKDGCVVSAHLLVPGWTHSDIMLNSKRADHPEIDPVCVSCHEAKPAGGAWMPDQVADYLQKELAKGTFYIICPDNETSEHTDNLRIAWAMQDYTERRPPPSRWHPDYKNALVAYITSNSAPSN